MTEKLGSLALRLGLVLSIFFGSKLSGATSLQEESIKTLTESEIDEAVRQLRNKLTSAIERLGSLNPKAIPGMKAHFKKDIFGDNSWQKPGLLNSQYYRDPRFIESASKVVDGLVSLDTAKMSDWMQDSFVMRSFDAITGHELQRAHRAIAPKNSLAPDEINLNSQELKNYNFASELSALVTLAELYSNRVSNFPVYAVDFSTDRHGQQAALYFERLLEYLSFEATPEAIKELKANKKAKALISALMLNASPEEVEILTYKFALKNQDRLGKQSQSRVNLEGLSLLMDLKTEDPSAAMLSKNYARRGLENFNLLNAPGDVPEAVVRNRQAIKDWQNGVKLQQHAYALEAADRVTYQDIIPFYTGMAHELKERSVEPGTGHTVGSKEAQIWKISEQERIYGSQYLGKIRDLIGKQTLGGTCGFLFE